MWNSLIWSGIVIGAAGLLSAWHTSRSPKNKDIIAYFGTMAATFSGVVLAAGITLHQQESSARQTTLAIFKAGADEANIKTGQIQIELEQSIGESRPISADFRKQIPALGIGVGALTTSLEAGLNGVSDEIRGSLIMSVNTAHLAHVNLIEASVTDDDLRIALERYLVELEHFRTLLQLQIRQYDEGLSAGETRQLVASSLGKRRLAIYPPRQEPASKQ